MKRKGLLAIGLALVLVTVGLCGCAQSSTTGGAISTQQEGIWVTGTGKVSIVPDIVTVDIGAEVVQTSIADAQSQSAEAMNKIMAALTSNGVAETDIQTREFSIHEVRKWDYDTDQSVLSGYRVTNMVTAKIRDIDKAGSIIDAAAEAGGDLTRINNLRFSVDDPSVCRNEARGKAMANAQAKAEQLAVLAGVTLGKPTYINEGVPTAPSTERFFSVLAEDANLGTSISAGEMEISATVQVAYAITD